MGVGGKHVASVASIEPSLVSIAIVSCRTLALAPLGEFQRSSTETTPTVELCP